MITFDLRKGFLETMLCSVISKGVKSTEKKRRVKHEWQIAECFPLILRMPFTAPHGVFFLWYNCSNLIEKLLLVS